MADPAIQDDAEAAPTVESRSRQTLLKRLADVVCLPGSRVNGFERAVTGDLLFDMLRLAKPEDRKRVAKRLAPLAEAPSSLVRLLLRDEPEIAGILIDESAALNDSDLIACVRHGELAHRQRVAARKTISETVTDALVEAAEPSVFEILLKNPSARLTQSSLEMMVGLSRDDRHLCRLLLARPEMKPSSAYVMFWWCGPEERRLILQRFAVSREVMQEVAEDVFAMAAAEDWQDAVSRKALQFIERRQRNRAAMARSPFGGLEAAVAAAAKAGLSPELAGEIAHMCGIKPLTGAKILGDEGGEPLAILCKATGMGKDQLRQLWRGLRRIETQTDGETNPIWSRVVTTYDMLAVDRAQTVLRYWNWSLSSALTPELLQAIRDGDEEQMADYSTPERAAILALAENFRR